MGMYDWLGQDEDEDSPFNVTKAAYAIGSPLYSMLNGDASTAIDPSDPRVQAYSEHARQPMPSESMYSKYIGEKPEYEAFGKRGILRSLGAALLGIGGQQQAARDLIHPGYRKAFEDWQTEGKYLPAQARAADVGRQKELEAEKFNIIGEAKKRQFEANQAKAKSAAEAKKAADELALRKQQHKEDVDRQAEQRREEADKRASAREQRAEEREQRLERESGFREDTGRRKGLEESYKLRTEAFKGEEKDIDKAVRDEFVSKHEEGNGWDRNDKGQVVFHPEALSAINAEASRRKAKGRPMMNEFDTPDVEEPTSSPIPPRPDVPWYQRLFGG